MSPKDGASVTTTNITISVQVANFSLVDKLGKVNVPGEGHIHYYMDVDAPTDPTFPAITGAGTYFATAATFHTWMNVPVGTHTFSAQLVNNDHKPIDTQAIAKIKVTVAPPPLPTATTIDLNTRNMMFNMGIITVRAGAAVTINLTNYDSGIQHNFALYDDLYDMTPIFSGQAIGGIASIIYKFTAPSVPGTYYFCDDVHRVDMSGQFVVVP